MFHSTDRSGPVWLLAGLLAVAATTAAAQPPAQKGRKAASASSVRFIDAPSSESPAARQARLKRECKGRPNAGACLGMTGKD